MVVKMMWVFAWRGWVAVKCGDVFVSTFELVSRIEQYRHLFEEDVCVSVKSVFFVVRLEVMATVSKTRTLVWGGCATARCFGVFVSCHDS